MSSDCVPVARDTEKKKDSLRKKKADIIHDLMEHSRGGKQ